MALNYHNQHLAWQQRISKEMNTAASFFGQDINSQQDRMRNTNYLLKKNTSGVIKKPCLKREQTPISKSISPSNANPHLTNVYAQVRGKYARPAPPLNHPYQFLTPNKSNLKKRPFTSGSYISSQKSTRSVSARKQEVQTSEKGFKQDIFKIRTRPGLSRNTTHGIQSQNILKLKEQHSQPQLDAGDQNASTELIEFQNQNQGGENQSEKSFITSSSHQSYIEKLEEMLRRERLKRIKAELALSAVSHR